jgi:hypothetical protein
MKHPWGGRVGSDKQDSDKGRGMRRRRGPEAGGGEGGGEKGRGQLVNNHL